MEISTGDYVLATKYSDGDPMDQWCVGFYDGMLGNKYLVVDKEGVSFRPSGFRRVTKISKKRGEFILYHKWNIAMGGRSMYWWARCTMRGA